MAGGRWHREAHGVATIPSAPAPSSHTREKAEKVTCGQKLRPLEVWESIKTVGCSTERHLFLACQSHVRSRARSTDTSSGYLGKAGGRQDDREGRETREVSLLSQTHPRTHICRLPPRRADRHHAWLRHGQPLLPHLASASPARLPFLLRSTSWPPHRLALMGAASREPQKLPAAAGPVP